MPIVTRHLALACLLAAPFGGLQAAEPKVEVLLEDLDQAWSLAELPDGRWLISERGGRLRRWAEGTPQTTLITGVPEVFAEGQGGLLGLLVDRDFARNQTVYLSYAHGSRRANGTRLARARLVGDALQDLQPIFSAQPLKDTSAHFGGRLAQLADGSLVLTLGDGFTYREAAQDLRSHLGKIVRVHPDGSVPADNPFRDRSDALPEIYSYGHRNVQGVVFDAARGALWSHEHGPRGGDELNRILPGANYGWPIATRGLDYSGAQVTPFATYAGMQDALHGWTPSIAPSAMTLYRGGLFAQWQNNLLVTALAGKSLRRLSPRADGGFDEETLLAARGERLRDVQVAADGSVLVLTDGAPGRLLRLTPSP